MASGDTKTQQYLNVAANGSRSDFPASCCESRTQTLIREVGERIMDVEDEVEELKNNPDVVDIVGTYADLQNYDTSGLTDKDVIRVLSDETHNGSSTYYRYSTTTHSFTYIGIDSGDRGVDESVTIATSDWTALSSSDPYTYQATKTITEALSSDSIIELENNQPVLFANYGFAIASADASNNTLTFYSIGEPSASVTLNVNIK